MRMVLDYLIIGIVFSIVIAYIHHEHFFIYDQDLTPETTDGVSFDTCEECQEGLMFVKGESERQISFVCSNCNRTDKRSKSFLDHMYLWYNVKYGKYSPEEEEDEEKETQEED